MVDTVNNPAEQPSIESLGQSITTINGLSDSTLFYNLFSYVSNCHLLNIADSVPDKTVNSESFENLIIFFKILSAVLTSSYCNISNQG